MVQGVNHKTPVGHMGDECMVSVDIKHDMMLLVLLAPPPLPSSPLSLSFPLSGVAFMLCKVIPSVAQQVTKSHPPNCPSTGNDVKHDLRCF